ncbi:MAG: hypothetical protein MR434_03205 [Ruminococcus sp.]|nr:hypothetical protein [Ruminococcus sp.]
MSNSECLKDYSILKLSQGFLHTFYFSFFVGGFYPTAPTFFHPMNLEFENSIEFYFYDLRRYVLQIISIRLSVNHFITTISKIPSINFSEKRQKNKALLAF